MKNFFHSLLFVIMLLTFIISCKDDNPEIITKSKLSGFVQKGPFLSSTSVTVSELSADLSQTGKTFNTQIKDNQGTFELSNLELLSPMIEMKADGFYFNEVTGEVSDSQISLYAIADISDVNSLNVNVISTLEKDRVKKLVSEGQTFAEAKKQAIKEILDIFSIEKSDIQRSEMLDINKSGDDNGILLAISAILQGYRSVSEFSELLANLRSDIAVDGKLNNETLGTALISHARFLYPNKIRENLVKRYSESGSDLQIPAFEKYISEFEEKTSFNALESIVSYPESVNGVLNILNKNNTLFQSSSGSYCLCTTAPKGFNLKIKLEFIEGGVLNFGYWSYRPSTVNNWIVSTYEPSHYQYFQVGENGRQSFMPLSFMSGGGVKIRISYYENNDNVPSRTRMITVI